MSNKSRISTKHHQPKATPTTSQRRLSGPLGRGRGRGLSRASDLETATLTNPSTEMIVENTVATSIQTLDDDRFSDDDMESTTNNNNDSHTDTITANAIVEPIVRPSSPFIDMDSDGDAISVTATVVATNTTTPHTTPNETTTDSIDHQIPVAIRNPYVTTNRTTNTVVTTPAINRRPVLIPISTIANRDSTNNNRPHDPSGTNASQIGNPDDDFIGPPPKPVIIPQPVRPYYGRFTWRIQTLPSDSSTDALIAGIQEVWEVLLATDPSLVIYPWIEEFAEDSSKCLTAINSCPRMTNELLEYFDSAYPRPLGGLHYINVRMGYGTNIPDLRRASAHFFDLSTNRYRVGFWYKGLQHDNTAEVGWLLGSTPFMSPDRIAEDIYQRSKGKLQVGCRWHMIAIKGSTGNLPEAQRVRAIHIEVKKEQLASATKYLGSLFSKHRVLDPVIGTPMRLVPLVRAVSQPLTQSLCAYARQRQGVFLHVLRNNRVYTLGSIDFRSPRMGNKSIRDLIMTIPSNSDPSRNLFLSCDKQPDGATVLTFLSKNQEEAYSRAQNLLAYLRFTNPPTYWQTITDAFSPSEQARASDVTWDPVTKSIVTQADLQLEALEDATDDDLFGYDTAIAQTFVIDTSAVKQGSIPKSSNSTDDDDSLPSFRSLTDRLVDSTPDMNPKPSARPRTSTTQRQTRTRSPPPNTTTTGTANTMNTNDDLSLQSEITLESMASRISVIENSVSQLVAMLVNNNIQTLASAQDRERPGAGRRP